MERIFLIRLKRVEFDDLRKILNIVILRAPVHFDKYYAITFFTPDTPNIIWYEGAEFGVYDLNHNLLGVFKINILFDTTIISFYIKNSQYRHVFLEYIQSTIKEIKFAGFTILDTQGFGEDTVTEDVYKRYKLPKRETDRKKWIVVYKCITDYLSELDESDDDEKFVPKLEDYRSRVMSEVNIEFSERTISRIKKACDAGLLSE